MGLSHNDELKEYEKIIKKHITTRIKHSISGKNIARDNNENLNNMELY